MKAIFASLILICFNAAAQAWMPSNSLFRLVSDNDSIIVYQCHVEKATQELKTASGQTITSTEQEMSITDKFVIFKHGESWSVKHFGSTLSVLPNRKFSGLKIRERPYWQFTCDRTFTIGENEIKALCPIEAAGRETIEYDFTVSKYTRNQIIIKKGKRFRQLLLRDDLVISQLPGFH